LKASLNSKQITVLLSSDSFVFKTKKFSFRYLPSAFLAFSFSISRRLGSAVKRNRLKRCSRALLSGPLFDGLSFDCLIRPSVPLQELRNIREDFVEFQQYLLNNLNNKTI
jgi:ribonuclease P protein component